MGFFWLEVQQNKRGAKRSQPLFAIRFAVLDTFCPGENQGANSSTRTRVIPRFASRSARLAGMVCKLECQLFHFRVRQ